MDMTDKGRYERIRKRWAGIALSSNWRESKRVRPCAGLVNTEQLRR